MKNTMITLAALFLFAATAQATLTVYPIAEKGNTSYSFSLKGEDRGYAIENIDAREGEFYIRRELCILFWFIVSYFQPFPNSLS